MQEIIAIDFKDLLFAYLLLFLPLLVFIYFRTRLLGPTVWAILRMTAQLSWVAFYLEYIFELNSLWVNSLWIGVMVGVSVFTTAQRSGLRWQYFLVPFTVATSTSLLLIDLFFLGFILKWDALWEARYVIPVSGMLLGNAIKHNIIGIRTYFQSLAKEENFYFFLLINQAQPRRALQPFIRESLEQALNPLIASMAVIGVISLPGMMTGQILGGSAPATAIKYQIMIMLFIFTGCTLNLILAILLSNTFIFDAYGRLKHEQVFRKKHK